MNASGSISSPEPVDCFVPLVDFLMWIFFVTFLSIVRVLSSRSNGHQSHEVMVQFRLRLGADQVRYYRAELGCLNWLGHKHLVPGFQCSQAIFDSHITC